MKKPSWKNVAAGKLVAAACGACLCLFTLSANAILVLPPIHFGRQTVNFDDLSSGNLVTYGYGGLGWYNFYTLDPSTLDTASGYLAGLKTPNNVILNSSSVGVPLESLLPNAPAPVSYSVIYSTGHAFILGSAYLTAAWNDNLQVMVQGYYNSKLAYTHTYTLSATKPTLVNFPSQPVTDVYFYSSGGTPHSAYTETGTQFAMDNLTYIMLPIHVLLL